MKASDKPGFLKSLFGLGRKPPARPALPLYIPLPMMKIESEAVAKIEAMWSQVMDKRLGPLVLLQEADRYLEKLNLLPLSYEQRARLSNILLDEVVTAIGSLFVRFFQQGGGIPETREQRESISYAVRAAEQLAISYKQLFRHDWADPAHDRTAQEKMTTAVLRILECVRLEQLLRAFRYQKLPQHAWRDVNQLFFALRGGWDIKMKHRLKIHMAVEDGSSRVELFPQTASIEQIYLSIQLTGLLDVISWPVHIMYRVDRYLGDIDASLASDEDKGGTVPPGHFIVLHNQGSPPRFRRGPDHLGSALLMDINPIIERAVQDRAALVSPAETAIISVALREIPERDRVAFLDLLLTRLQPQQRRDERHRAIDARRVRVYGGFDAVYRLFRTIERQAKGQGTAADEQRYQDNFAEDIGLVTGRETVTMESRWIISDEGSGGVQLRQQEADYSMPLYVGRLVAYNHGTEDYSRSRLGYVVRLQRIGDDEVEVAIARVREHIRAVVVEDLDSMDQLTLSALLIRGMDGKWQLLCDNKHNFITGERLVVIDGGKRYSGALGDIMLAQTDFSIFELHVAE